MLELEGRPLASFARRGGALLLDLIAASVIFLAVAVPVAMVWDRMHPGHETALEFAPLGAEHTNWYSVLVFAAYISLSVYVSNGWTLGKRALGIRVVSTVNERMTLWQSVERALGYGVSAAELGLGFLQYFVAPNCRTTHDRIADTVVIDTRRPRAEPTAPPTGDQPSRERVAPS